MLELQPPSSLTSFFTILPPTKITKTAPAELRAPLVSFLRRIARVTEVVEAFLRGKPVGLFAAQGFALFAGARLTHADLVLGLGEDLFDRIELGTEGRQLKQFGARAADRFGDALDLVAGEVVHHHDVAGLEHSDNYCSS